MSGANDKPAAIRVEGLWKRYGLPLGPVVHQALDRARQMVGVAPAHKELPWALQEIAFEVRSGETLGIIGRNGSGKSTLLKVLAGVTPPTRGTVEIIGSIFPMIELNAGIHMELTGRENIRLLAAVLGISSQRLRETMPKIEAFCELGEWLDRPVRMYSSGMLVRLGFAVGAHIDADILLMDEVMAVGDLSFYNKCVAYLEALREEGKCTLFVSHNMHRVRRMCDRVLLIDKGVPLFLGDTEEGLERYEEIIRNCRDTGSEGAHRNFDYFGVTLERAVYLRADGSPAEPCQQGEDVTLDLTLSVARPLAKPTFNIVLENMETVAVLWETHSPPDLKPGVHHLRVTWRDLRLKAGVYVTRVGIVAGSMDMKGFRASDCARLTMAGDALLRGILKPQVTIEHDVSDLPEAL
ncbi:polysaccharide ABC transporter ATP-binding protein [Magnetofaba australis]|uniref:Putative ABC transporter n=1 Tax=Magnetofaba australis IT-1 TaxID=1434232 RepID=A0A1Y2JYW5_9PROT|nr:polysaccharide ABC transporter ATP-binding protein [Magnetofaba australis]OSM00076.1 putative ABC transporter [Magnetofaba australis IT-1]